MNPQPACNHGRTLPANTGATVQFLLTHPQFRRQQVLRETLLRLEQATPHNRYHLAAERNLARWHRQAAPTRSGANPRSLAIQVLPLDWGEATLMLTKIGRAHV